MLKYIVDDINVVAEPHRALYEGIEGGKFRLNVEGAVPREKLDEFRQTNIDLLKKAEEFKGIDPKKYNTLLSLEKRVTDKELVDAGKIEEVVTSRIASMQQEHSTIVTDLGQKLEVSNKQLESLVIDSAVRVKALEAGVLPTAVDDVMLRAKTTFKIVDGKAVPHTDGKPVYGKDGVNTMSVEEWITTLSKQAPHLFGESVGGNAQGRRQNTGVNNHLSEKRTSTQKISAGLAALQ